MSQLIMKIKQLFCKHTYYVHFIKGGFYMVEGWACQPFILICKKCGKVIMPEKFKELPDERD